MTPRRKFDVYEFVKYDKQTNKSTCLVKGCGRILSGKKGYNIKRHYRLEHKIILDNDIDRIITNEPVSTAPTKNVKKPSTGLKIDLNKKEFLKCCIGLVTMKSIPFRIFDDNDFFKKIIAPYEHQFNIDINSVNITSIMEKASQEIKQKIYERVQNKMVSLKLDFASRMGRTILCINVQYVEESTIFSYTIGIIEITKVDKAQLIKNKICECLKEMKIELALIYPNMDEVYTSEDNNSDENQIYSQIDHVFSAVKCSGLTLQLVAQDVMKLIEFQINECIKVAKILRVLNRMENINVNMPSFDDVTRWDLIYKMINSLWSQKEHITTIHDMINVEIDWNFIETFVSAFKPLFECTLKTQSEQCGLCDFYRDLLCCDLELQEISNTNYHARLLHEALTNRKSRLFEQSSFVAALYLDGRFNFEDSPMLTDDQKKVAVKHLLETYETIQQLGIINLKRSESMVENSITVKLPTNNVPSTSKDSYIKLTKHIQQMIKCSQSSTQRNLKQRLTSLCDRNKKSFHTKVLENWKINCLNDPELHQLGQIILAVPGTQVSGQRIYDALNKIFSKLGTNIEKRQVENIFLCKLNFDLLQFCTLQITENEVLLDVLS